MRRLCWLLVLVVGPTVRADAIDKGLIDNAPELVAFCKARKLGCIGALRFRAALGDVAPSHRVEPLCANLATRVENLLVLMLPKDGPGVIRAAGDQALARSPDATHATTSGRERLFKYKYSLAWKAEKLTPDAFVTGEVRFASDLTRATVLVQAFLKSDPARLVRVVEFSVAVDRDMLCDAGLTFQVPASKVRQASAVELDRLAVASAVSLRARGKDSSASSANVLVEPASGSGPVRLRNLADRKVGLVLRFAGRNTIDEQVDVAGRCHRWMLAEKQAATVKGFYRSADASGREVMPFKSSRRGPSDLSSECEAFVESQVLLDGGEAAVGTLPSLRGLTTAERARCKTRQQLRAALVKRAALKPDGWDLDRSYDLHVGGSASRSSMRHPTLIEYRRMAIKR